MSASCLNISVLLAFTKHILHIFMITFLPLNHVSRLNEAHVSKFWKDRDHSGLTSETP
jgi:hypothetical protein